MVVPRFLQEPLPRELRAPVRVHWPGRIALRPRAPRLAAPVVHLIGREVNKERRQALLLPLPLARGHQVSRDCGRKERGIWKARRARRRRRGPARAACAPLMARAPSSSASHCRGWDTAAQLITTSNTLHFDHITSRPSPVAVVGSRAKPCAATASLRWSPRQPRGDDRLLTEICLVSLHRILLGGLLQLRGVRGVERVANLRIRAGSLGPKGGRLPVCS